MSKIFELFGYRLDSWSSAADDNLAEAHCPFMDDECDGGGNRQQSALTLVEHPKLAKCFPGKSRVQAGVCSLTVVDGEQPWIVCPRRLLSLRSGGSGYQDYVKDTLTQHIGIPKGKYRVWTEVKMKVDTATDEDEAKYFDYTFDYIVAGSCKMKVVDIAALTNMTAKKVLNQAEKHGYSLAIRDGTYWVENFPCGPIMILEIMTSSTSGGNKKTRTQIAMAFEDAVLNGAHNGPGINYRQVWARMVSQLIVKSEVALSWGGRTIWLIQDVLADYISESTALDLSKYLSKHAGEVNILSFGYGDLAKGKSVLPLSNSKFYAGPISTDDDQSGFVDIVKLGAAPPVDHLWRALFNKAPVASLLVP